MDSPGNVLLTPVPVIIFLVHMDVKLQPFLMQHNFCDSLANDSERRDHQARIDNSTSQQDLKNFTYF